MTEKLPRIYFPRYTLGGGFYSPSFKKTLDKLVKICYNDFRRTQKENSYGKEKKTSQARDEREDPKNDTDA